MVVLYLEVTRLSRVKMIFFRGSACRFPHCAYILPDVSQKVKNFFQLFLGRVHPRHPPFPCLPR